MPKYGFNDYIVDNEYIILKCYGNKKEYQVYINKKDLNKVRQFGRVSITSAGYPTNTKHQLLHRYLLDCPDDMVVDHIDRNPLNNIRSNLRIVTRSMNGHNKKVQSNSTSGINGVHKCGNGWRASIYIKGKGYRKFFKKQEDAIAYRKELEKLYHPFGGVL